jgi:hypothetical protein
LALSDSLLPFSAPSVQAPGADGKACSCSGSRNGWKSTAFGRQHTTGSKIDLAAPDDQGGARGVADHGALVDRIAFLEDRVLKMEEDMDINITPKKMNASNSSNKRNKGLNITSC